MSYYSLYRPQTVTELDQMAVRTALLQILSSGKFSHAYLFSGPKGTGKTSSARILAKVLNCETNRAVIAAGTGSLHEPCNSCDSCKRITNGSSLACMEMDAASNRGIDDIRTLRERIGLAPAEGLMAVYIIDEVHMLTTEAFNALLKTLEEPPKHAVFILCTTDPEKIPETVTSRCTNVQFYKASVKEVVASLSKVVTGEGIVINNNMLEVIASRVDGSFRDGMKLLEQLAQSGKEIVIDMVNEVTGHGALYDTKPLIQALLDKDVSVALAQLASKQEAGLDIGVYARRLIEESRQQLLTILLGDNQAETLRFVQLTEHIEEAVMRVRRATIPLLPLEIMVARWCLTKNRDVQPLPSVEKPIVKHQHVEQPISSSVQEKPEIERLQPPKNAFDGALSDIVARWQDILVAVRPLNHSLEGVLRSARPAQYEHGWLTIEAFYKFHKERLEQDRHRKILEAAIGNLLGGAVQLKFALGEKIRRTESVDSETTSAVHGADDALVKAAEEVFGA